MIPTIAIAALFAGLLLYILRTRERERETYLNAIMLAIKEGTREREDHRALVAELTEKIQHPEIVHPTPALVKPGPPPDPDPAFTKTGKIFTADDNGN